MEPLLTTEEVAKLLKVSRRTVYDLLKVRAIPSVKVPGQYRIRIEALEEFIRKEEQRPIEAKYLRNAPPYSPGPRRR